jgi:hypothetical protein
MCKFKTVAAARLVALALCALPISANAAGAGHGVQAAQTYYGAGPGINAAASQGADLYAPSGIGNITNNASMNFTPGGGGSTSFSGMTGNVNVQTNIDNSKVINSTSNVSVNETINGSNVAYGLDGANALTVINNNSSYDADVSGMFTGTAENLENEALAVAQAMGQ